jgi:hypothetical protein
MEYSNETDTNSDSDILDKPDLDTIGIGPITEKLIKKIIDEIKKEKNMNMIRENILDPVLHDVFSRFFPHAVILLSLLVIIILLLIFILIM